MIASRALHIYLGTTAALGGYYAGREAYRSPRWFQHKGGENELPAVTVITRSLTTMVGTALGALAGPVMIPYQALTGISEGVQQWAEERDNRKEGVRKPRGGSD